MSNTINSKLVINLLSRYIVIRHYENTNQHSINAYQKIIDYLIKNEGEYTLDELLLIQGVGPKIRANLKSIFNNRNDEIKTGIYEIDKFLKEGDEGIEFFSKIAYVTDLMTVPGVGFVKANKLYEQGIRSSYEIMPNKDEIEKRIPYKLIKDFENKLSEFIDVDIFKIAGSFRRRVKDSKDIDIIFTDIDSKELVDYLTEFGIVVDTISLGPNKFQGHIYLSPEFPLVRADFLFTQDKSEFSYALLYFTGSKQFNIELKKIAQNKGYTLGNVEMRKFDNQQIIVESEEQIFDVLELEFVEPKDRNL